MNSITSHNNNNSNVRPRGLARLVDVARRSAAPGGGGRAAGLMHDMSTRRSDTAPSAPPTASLLTCAAYIPQP